MPDREACATFSVEGEDHTLGNALRFVLNKSPHTALCGCSVPHPSEEVVNVRVQTTGALPAAQVFREGLTDLMAICDIVNDSFAVELERFRKKKGKRNSGARPMDTD